MHDKNILNQISRRQKIYKTEFQVVNNLIKSVTSAFLSQSLSFFEKNPFKQKLSSIMK